MNSYEDFGMTHTKVDQPPSLPPFHLAFTVRGLDEARGFYCGLLGCAEGRSTDKWIDFNFFGHQLVTHLSPTNGTSDVAKSEVDGQQVPASHFGAVIPMELWQKMADALRQNGWKFLIEPHIRYAGQPAEQATMFFCDPSGNAIEMKSFKDLDQLFAK